ncbi:MAG: cysteine--tRNA ligase [Actinomycetota bacterium]|nr:cysteine--tRNA ligase [Actinomycetota bacterium]
MLLYDSLSRAKEELPPPPGPIGMYVCGPTVYQRIHVGNARPYVVFLWLKRWLEELGYAVRLVENVTDINDKIYDAAREQGIASAELAVRATRWYVEDTDELGLGRPDVEPLASETIPEIVALIEELLGRGLAYESGGDVYFRVSRFPEYGALSGAKREDMVAQEPSDRKEDPRDFALWKATKPHEDTSWGSPWGDGRPGWHVECSAMAEKHLGASFELHGGGLDLRFPHHENEIAQSRGAGRPFARVWAHNGMLELAAEKMAKSVGNVVTLRDALDRWGREAILLLFLGAHYRSPVEYSDDAMEQARAQAETFRNHFVGRDYEPEKIERERLAEILDDDFNTAEALALLHEWRASGKTSSLSWGLEVFGLASLTRQPRAPGEIRELAERRLRARREREFSEADRLRAEIERSGWEIRDVVDGFELVPK